ncbi:MAG TPA: ABC transporter substrate-binding protein, partial [Actinomycetes bacterium]|nr:ABC transporter substrate-binding protein [Actinomycetes bacterium]
PMRLAVPDLVSSSYFPVLAAAELGLFAQEGVDVELQQVYPVTSAAIALRDGEIDFLVGPAHAPLKAFPDWAGVKLLAAVAQHIYWLLVVRCDLDVAPGDLAGLHDLRIAAARGPEQALRQLFAEAHVSLDDNRITIGPPPASEGQDTSFGLSAAAALRDGRIDAFWANAMAAEIAVNDGAGRVFLDPRRGQGPARARSFTFAAAMATDAVIAEHPRQVAALVRGIVGAQQALKEDPQRAAAVGRRLFPAAEAGFITDLVRRDLPFYDAKISHEAVDGLNGFARRAGMCSAEVSYDDVVAQGLDTRGDC